MHSLLNSLASLVQRDDEGRHQAVEEERVKKSKAAKTLDANLDDFDEGGVRSLHARVVLLLRAAVHTPTTLVVLFCVSFFSCAPSARWSKAGLELR